ncbi:MAG: CRISPR-associated protein [Tannerellaceae bacterium]
MLINLSNHPSALWSNKQLMAAQEFGDIYDLEFPSVDPDKGGKYIESLAIEYFGKIEIIISREAVSQIVCVHLMGEISFCFALFRLLRQHEIRCVVSTSRRVSYTDELNQKISEFNFVRFREII